MRTESVTNQATGDGSCCCGGECECGCCTGVGYWTQYTITVAGITDSGPNPCDICPTELNGTFTLFKVPGESCFWDSTEQTQMVNCGGAESGAVWRLGCVAGEWFLANGILGCGASLYKSILSFCDGGTIPLDAASAAGCGSCGEFPATVTVTPGGTWVSCGMAEPMGLAAARVASRPAAEPSAGKRRKSLPCVHLGDSVSGEWAAKHGLNPVQDWRPCGVGLTKNPVPNAAPGIVCRCTGCGPECERYVADDE